MELGFPRWVGVVCEDFEKQRSFYRDVLGLRERDEGDGWVQYDMGPARGTRLGSWWTTSGPLVTSSWPKAWSW